MNTPDKSEYLKLDALRWRHYLEGARALAYVLDTADRSTPEGRELVAECARAIDRLEQQLDAELAQAAVSSAEQIASSPKAEGDAP